MAAYSTLGPSRKGVCKRRPPHETRLVSHATARVQVLKKFIQNITQYKKWQKSQCHALKRTCRTHRPQQPYCLPIYKSNNYCIHPHKSCRLRQGFFFLKKKNTTTPIQNWRTMLAEPWCKKDKDSYIHQFTIHSFDQCLKVHTNITWRSCTACDTMGRVMLCATV